MMTSDADGGDAAGARPRIRRIVRPPPPADSVPSIADAADEAPLLRPDAACPRCGARPAMRVTRALVRALRDQAADTRVATYQCQRRGCGAVYDLLAGACVRAS